jgi:CRP-like cAMP-binding protein
MSDRGARTHWLDSAIAPQRAGPSAVMRLPERNRLLGALPAEDYSRLLPDLKPVQLNTRQRLALPEEVLECVYFPRDAVVSMLVLMRDGKAVESAAVGNEGMVGLEVFLGNGLARDEIVVQFGGEALSMSAASFRRAVGRSGELQSLLHQYSLALLHQLARAAGCNQVHSVDERCARWLLTSQDRVGRDEFPVTHDVLAKILGVRRASVSVAAEAMQRGGLIQYRQGSVHIVDRRRLERVACEDYRLSKAAYDELY